MAKISVIENNIPVNSFSLTAGTVSIGRAKNNDVRIQDSTVSSHHAKIVTFYNASYIEDLGSTNGTFVNGKRVKKQTLKSGDIISLGALSLKVENEEAVEPMATSLRADAEDTSSQQVLTH
jgi:pSer/pThr/pTyr-binding forkhead associated (FHA) protein